MKTPKLDVQINRQSELLMNASYYFGVAVFLFACFIRVPSQFWFRLVFGLSILSIMIAAATGQWSEIEEEEHQ